MNHKKKSFFGKKLVDEKKASKKTIIYGLLIAIVTSIFLSDGEFKYYSRFGPAKTITLRENPFDFYIWIFLFVVLPLIVVIWEAFKLFKLRVKPDNK